ncbi:MAG TPA: lactate utilization protein [Methanoregula sp.]|nr:lactate utilization protein [Methanoregula sp.]
MSQFSAVNLMQEAGADPGKWNTIPSPDVVSRTERAIEARGIRVIKARGRDDALAKVKEIIPPGAEIMTGSSTTLIEIGLEDFIRSGKAGWKSLHTAITSENDDQKRAELRRKSVTADYFISGANAIAQTGEIVSCDASGSRVGAWPFAAGHLVLVVGINKIVPDVGTAMKRIQEYTFLLENARAMRAYGTPSAFGKWVILAQEKIPGRITVVLVEEALGY